MDMGYPSIMVGVAMWFSVESRSWFPSQEGVVEAGLLNSCFQKGCLQVLQLGSCSYVTASRRR